jgi:hypothetical protein
MAEHKTQRKAVWPAFQGHVIRELVPNMWHKSLEFADVIASEIDRDTGMLEFSEIVSRATLGGPPTHRIYCMTTRVIDIFVCRYYRRFRIWQGLSNAL